MGYWNRPKFKVGDVVGNNVDGTRIIYKVERPYRHGYQYCTFRTDPDDIKVNGKTANYSQESLEQHFEWLRFEPAVELLYNR